MKLARLLRALWRQVFQAGLGFRGPKRPPVMSWKPCSVGRVQFGRLLGADMTGMECSARDELVMIVTEGEERTGISVVDRRGLRRKCVIAYPLCSSSNPDLGIERLLIESGLGPE
jgi:hypothetical protein